MGSVPPAHTEGGGTHRVWYGWQNLLVDVGAFGIAAVGGSLHSDEALLVGAAGYLVGGPLVHAGNGHGAKALGSFGLRAGLPVLGAFVALGLAGDCSGDSCGGEAAVYRGFGGFIGLVGAIIIDDAFLAVEDVPSGSSSARFSIAPTVAVTPKVRSPD